MNLPLIQDDVYRSRRNCVYMCVLSSLATLLQVVLQSHLHFFDHLYCLALLFFWEATIDSATMTLDAR